MIQGPANEQKDYMKFVRNESDCLYMKYDSFVRKDY